MPVKMLQRPVALGYGAHFAFCFPSLISAYTITYALTDLELQCRFGVYVDGITQQSYSQSSIIRQDSLRGQRMRRECRKSTLKHTNEFGFTLDAQRDPSCLLTALASLVLDGRCFCCIARQTDSSSHVTCNDLRSGFPADVLPQLMYARSTSNTFIRIHDPLLLPDKP